MTREEIDTLWQRALHDAIQEGEQFTRYHFAALVLEAAALDLDDMAASPALTPLEKYRTAFIQDAIRQMKPKGDAPCS